MLAARRLTADATELAVVEVPTPEPGPGQARIAVTGAGLCGTDLHILHGDYSSRPPVTLGHEVAGVVDAVGDGVDDAWLGALVAPETAFGTCGTCRWCRTGRPMLCAERLSIGSGVDGGFAAHLVVPARLLHRLPSGFDDHAAALMEPLACVCNAILDPGVVQAGDRVLVSGAGPVGILAGQVARASGGVVTLLGTNADAERLAIAAGLGMAVMSVEDASAQAALAARAAAREVDVVIECAGVEAAVRSGLEWVRPGGRYVQVGLLSGLVSIPFGLVVTREIDIRATFGSSPAAWMRATELVGQGKVDLAPLVSAVLPLTGWREAIERQETRRGLKTVLDPRLA
jgi:L-iditol 2-dehydrogenase